MQKMQNKILKREIWLKGNLKPKTGNLAKREFKT